MAMMTQFDWSGEPIRIGELLAELERDLRIRVLHVMYCDRAIDGECDCE
jgi:hypothetical protein